MDGILAQVWHVLFQVDLLVLPQEPSIRFIFLSCSTILVLALQWDPPHQIANGVTSWLPPQ